MTADELVQGRLYLCNGTPRQVRRWFRRAGRARSNLFCIVPTFFVGRLQRWTDFEWTSRRLFVARWGFWEASVETWTETIYERREDVQLLLEVDP